MQQSPRGSFAGLHCSVQKADVVDRRVLSGEQEATLGLAGQLAVCVALSNSVVGVGGSRE